MPSVRKIYGSSPGILMVTISLLDLCSTCCVPQAGTAQRRGESADNLNNGRQPPIANLFEENRSDPRDEPRFSMRYACQLANVRGEWSRLPRHLKYSVVSLRGGPVDPLFATGARLLLIVRVSKRS